MAEDRKLKVVLDEQAPESTEVLAKAIIAVSDAMKKIEKGPLSRRALVILIHDAVRGRVGRPAIEDVLDALPRLKELYTKKEKTDGR